MTHPGIAFLRLVSPWVIAAAILATFWAITPNSAMVTIPFFGGVSLDFVYRTTAIVRVIESIVVLAGACFFHAQRSYAGYFPTYLKFCIRFDEDGIQRSLDRFNTREYRSLNIQEKWQEYHRSYIAFLNGRLSDPNVGNAKLAQLDDSCAGEGTFHYDVRKITGWQRYKMEDASGTVRLHFPAKGRFKEETILIEFKLDRYGENIIDATTGDIFWRFTKILRQTYVQRIVMGPVKLEDIAHFLAPTKVRFFPRITISNTVYMVDRRVIERGAGHPPKGTPKTMVPVGYAEYELN